MVTLLFGWIFASGFINGVVLKKNSNAFCGKGGAAYFLFTCLCSGTALLFFAILAKFNIKFNLQTFAYAVAFFAIIMMNYVVTLLVLKYASVAKTSLIRTAGSTILLFMLGILLFKEVANVYKWIGLAFMILTICLSARGGEEPDRDKSSKIILAVCLILNVVLGAASSVLMKYYSADPNVSDNNSYFFITNVLLFVFGGIGFLIFFIKNKEKVKAFTDTLRFKDYAMVVCKTIIDNLTSLASMVLIGTVNLTFYTILSSSLGVLSAIVVSVVLKEKITAKLILAAVFAITAIVFNVL